MSNIKEIIETIIATLGAREVKKGKVSVEELTTAFNSEDFKEEIKKLLEKSMPKQRTISGEKKLKDENAPKRPKSAYMFFCEKKRSEIREENPELKMTEVAKLLGQRWKEVSPESKARYVKKADKDKERYAEDMKDYVRPSDEVLLEQKINQKRTTPERGRTTPERGRTRSKSSSGKKTRSKKPEGAPKGAKSAYIFFCAAKRDEVKEAFPDYKMTDISKELGRMWKEDFATDEDREEYVRQATEDKERYAREKAEWEATKTSENVERDEPEEREVKTDEYYYGKIPSKCTYEKLVTIMAKALIKFRKEYHFGEDVNYEDVIQIMDLWFEHDANHMEHKFDYLVKDERYDEFEQDVLKSIKSLEGEDPVVKKTKKAVVEAKTSKVGKDNGLIQ